MANSRLACSVAQRMMGVGNNGLMLLCLSEEPMISLHDQRRAAIRHAFDALPEEMRAEIVDGEIIVSPLQLNAHQLIIMDLAKLLARTTPEDWLVDTSGGVIIEPDWDEYRPDLLVAPRAAWPKEGNSGPDLTEVKLVVEVTSSGKRNLERDRETKFRVYAGAGIALYLLVDRYDGKGFTTLYSNPSGTQYLDAHKVPFGEKLKLPEPFDVEIDSAQF
jgi:Uma2 family endonuclease